MTYSESVIDNLYTYMAQYVVTRGSGHCVSNAADLAISLQDGESEPPMVSDEDAGTKPVKYVVRTVQIGSRDLVTSQSSP